MNKLLVGSGFFSLAFSIAWLAAPSPAAAQIVYTQNFNSLDANVLEITNATSPAQQTTNAGLTNSTVQVGRFATGNTLQLDYQRATGQSGGGSDYSLSQVMDEVPGNVGWFSIVRLTQISLTPYLSSTFTNADLANVSITFALNLPASRPLSLQVASNAETGGILTSGALTGTGSWSNYSLTLSDATASTGTVAGFVSGVNGDASKRITLRFTVEDPSPGAWQADESFQIDNVQVTVVPEPSTVALGALACSLLAARALRRSRKV